MRNVNIKSAPLAIRKLIDGRLDPMTFASVQKWVKECYGMPSDDELLMCAANELLECFGIEAIGNVSAVYCNTGDSYAPTLIHDLDNDRLLWCSWGDFVEHEESKGRAFTN